jgi:hypothetical protein
LSLFLSILVYFFYLNLCNRIKLLQAIRISFSFRSLFSTNVGADFTQSSFVEGSLLLENLKKMLISFREVAARWLGLIKLGLVRDEVVLIAGPIQGPTNNELALSGEGENCGLRHLKE